MQLTRAGSLYVIRFEDGEVFPSRFLEFLKAESMYGGSFTGIGAMSSARIAYFDTEVRDYVEREIREQVEVLALMGNVALYAEQPLVHAHITLGRRDYTTLGGHLREGVVCPTLEVHFHVAEEALERTVDSKYGLPTLELKEPF